MVEWLMFVSSLILAIITLVYVRLTSTLVKTQKEMLKISNTPAVEIFLTRIYISKTLYMIKLSTYNRGTGIAFDLKYSGNFSSFPPLFGDRILENLDVIRNGISHLGPGMEDAIPLYKVDENIPTNLPSEILAIELSYKDATGEEHNIEEPFRLNFNHVDSYTQTAKPEIDNIARSLRSIDDNLSEIKDSINLNQRQ